MDTYGWDMKTVRLIDWNESCTMLYSDFYLKLADIWLESIVLGFGSVRALQFSISL